MKVITYIAGGSQGLGKSLVEKCLKSTHQTFEFSRSGQGDHHIQCDFNQVNQAIHTFNEVFEAGKSSQPDEINLIINTAILPPFGSLAKSSITEIDTHLTVNIEATLKLLHTFMTHFQTLTARKSISYISSGAARRPIPGLAMYSASKAFFERFIDTLAKEQEQQANPFRCMIINPGVMDTGMQAEIRQQSVTDFPMLPWWQELYENNQLADPNAVADVIFKLLEETGDSGGYYVAQDLFE